MPRRIQFADGNVTEYVYTATGRKLRAVYYTAVPGITVWSGETHQLTDAEILSKDSIDYLGSLTLVNGVPDQYLFPGGYCQLNEGNVSGNIGWHYYNYDHLGNNREVVSESGTLEQVTNYYPFGAPFCERTTAGANTNATLQRYKYNGKELDLMHGLKWYDYSARMYDPILLTWNGIDPLCEDYYPISPYAYCHNSPINRIDPNGMDDYYNKEGVYLGTNKAETDYIYIIDEGQYWKLENGKYVIKTASRIALNDAELDADAYSKIFTNCFKLGGGNCSELVDGKIQVTIWQREGGSKVSYSHTEKASYEGNATASTIADHTNGAGITVYIWPIGEEERELFSTRSNIVSTIIDHEFKGHYKNGFVHVNGVLDPTFKLQKKSINWNKTTLQFKEYYNKVIKEHGWE